MSAFVWSTLFLFLPLEALESLIHRRNRKNRALGKNISQKRSSRFENTRDIDASSSRETSSSKLSLLKAYLSLRVFWI